jgi:hypothetical protein
MLNNLTNFFNLITGRRIKRTLERTDLIPLGTRDSSFGGGYKPTAITVQDFLASLGCKIVISGTSGLFNTDNGVEFQVPYNNTQYNESLTDFEVVGNKIKVLNSGKYLILARYSSYDMADGNDFLRLGVVVSGTKIEYLDQGFIGTGFNGEASKAGSCVLNLNAGDIVGIVALHGGANGGNGNQGYPVFDNSFFNQPYLQIIKL